MRRAPLIVALAALAVVGVLAGCDSTSGNQSNGSATVPRNWPVPNDPTAAAERAGLEMLGREMLEVHYHAHLEVTVRGVDITVPAGIGIDAAKQTITALHTHDQTGIVHIESAEEIPFTLGQFFTEWDQPLSATQVGPIKVDANEEVRLYRNGTVVPGDPAAVRFAAHDQLVVWLGPKGEQPDVRATYVFPAGL